MTSDNFNRPGAVDLGALAGVHSGGYVTDVDEAGLEAVIRKSLQHPVVLEFHSPRDNAGKALSADLAALADSAGGKYLVARVDVDAQPRIAQALGVNAVPTVIAIIGGQAAPLFQGTRPKEEIESLLDQMVAAAVANGIVGRAEPVATGSGESDEPARDPRLAAADRALLAGDLEKADAEFDKYLAENPGDPDATAGKAQAQLLIRAQPLDASRVVARAAEAPGDVAAQLEAADLELVHGEAQAAFDRLLQVIAEADEDDKELVRLRLLDYFEVVGRTHPLVGKARRRLMSALY